MICITTRRVLSYTNSHISSFNVLIMVYIDITHWPETINHQVSRTGSTNDPTRITQGRGLPQHEPSADGHRDGDGSHGAAAKRARYLNSRVFLKYRSFQVSNSDQQKLASAIRASDIPLCIKCINFKDFLLGSKLSAQDLSLMQRNIKNEKNDTEH